VSGQTAVVLSLASVAAFVFLQNQQWARAESAGFQAAGRVLAVAGVRHRSVPEQAGVQSHRSPRAPMPAAMALDIVEQRTSSAVPVGTGS
jgi:hypothetical protein